MDNWFGIEGKCLEELIDDYDPYFSWLWWNKFSWVEGVDPSIGEDDFLQICREQFIVTYNAFDLSYKKPFDGWLKGTLTGRVAAHLCVISKLLSTKLRGTGAQAKGPKRPCYVQSLDALMEMYR